jgi:hypothetical protein
MDGEQKTIRALQLHGSHKHFEQAIIGTVGLHGFAFIRAHNRDGFAVCAAQVCKPRTARAEQLQRMHDIDGASGAWDRALDMAEAYFRGDTFEKRYLSHVEASKRMLKYLDGPNFEFDRKGWDSFYEIPELGRLDTRYRDKVFKAGSRLREALRELVENPLETIPAVLRSKGQLRIKGFGVNTVSKILAASYPSEWPVYNSRVAKTLADFGYKAPHGAGADGRYLAFRNSMKKFMDACKLRGVLHVDAISLDAFFYDRSKELGY